MSFDQATIKTGGQKLLTFNEPMKQLQPMASEMKSMHPEAASALDEHYTRVRELHDFNEAESKRNQENR